MGNPWVAAVGQHNLKSGKVVCHALDGSGVGIVKISLEEAHGEHNGNASLFAAGIDGVERVGIGIPWRHAVGWFHGKALKTQLDATLKLVHGRRYAPGYIETAEGDDLVGIFHGKGVYVIVGDGGCVVWYLAAYGHTFSDAGRS